jgi:hypothetical protein
MGGYDIGPSRSSSRWSHSTRSTYLVLSDHRIHYAFSEKCRHFLDCTALGGKSLKLHAHDLTKNSDSCNLMPESSDQVSRLTVSQFHLSSLCTSFRTTISFPCSLPYFFPSPTCLWRRSVPHPTINTHKYSIETGLLYTVCYASL